MRSLNMFTAKAPIKLSDRFAFLTDCDEHEETQSSQSARNIPIELLVTVSKRQKKRTKKKALTRAREGKEATVLF